MSAPKNCIPIYDQKFGDLKTAWKELVKASIIGMSEQAILFTYVGPINDITIPGIKQSAIPIKTAAKYRIPANKYLIKFFFKTMYGTFQVMTSLFLKYKAGITIYKTVNNEITT